MPPTIAGLEIAFATRPQNTVAGDYYDAFLRTIAAAEWCRGAARWYAVADVAGKSVPAALLMATFQASLRALDGDARRHSTRLRSASIAIAAPTVSMGGVSPPRSSRRLILESREMSLCECGPQRSDSSARLRGRSSGFRTGGPPFGLPLFTDDRHSRMRLVASSFSPATCCSSLPMVWSKPSTMRVKNTAKPRLLPCVQKAPAANPRTKR